MMKPCIAIVALASLQAADCTRTSTGLEPLSDPFFVFRYEGAAGGLYPNGANQRPEAHEAAGLRLVGDVRPRGASGAADNDGRIVFLAIGMSNATQEFSVFKTLAERDAEKNPRVVVVDGAQGGWSADRIVAGGAEYWATVDQRLRGAGVTAPQVQVAWLKGADASPTLRFPGDARRLQSELQAIAQTLRSRFANLKLLYLSSRIYGGYATTNLNPEPYAYQSGFAVKWLIEQQIQGDPEVSFEGGKVPWMSWGPYLWADGTNPRPDGLVWNCSDFEPDGTHPSPSGRQKVANMLLDFVKSDTTAQLWFVRPTSPPPAPAAASLVNSATFRAEITAGSIATLFGTGLAASAFQASSLPLPHSLAGTRVEVGGETAALFYVSLQQINFLVPRSPPGDSVVVIREGVRSNAVTARFSIYAPGIFTLDGRPEGPAAALHADGRAISPPAPARRGEIIMMFATGSGVRNPLSLRPEILPIVRVGGVSAEVTYSGPAPGFPGLDQINLVVPRDAPTGPAVPVELLFGTSASNTASLAVGPF